MGHPLSVLARAHGFCVRVCGAVWALQELLERASSTRAGSDLVGAPASLRASKLPTFSCTEQVDVDHKFKFKFHLAQRGWCRTEMWCKQLLSDTTDTTDIPIIFVNAGDMAQFTLPNWFFYPVPADRLSCCQVVERALAQRLMGLKRSRVVSTLIDTDFSWHVLKVLRASHHGSEAWKLFRQTSTSQALRGGKVHLAR